MAFDGLMMHLLTNEFKELLIGSKIDKIYQPEKDELILSTRGHKGNNKVIISIDSSMPFITITDQKRENPKTPPMFCMLLRKHISGGKILDIKQCNFDRVIVFEIESKDELGHPLTKNLIVEIMGKHSNVILIDSTDNRIIDSLKRITPEISRVRTILPNIEFKYLESVKKNPLDVSSEDIFEAFQSEEYRTRPLFKFIYIYFDGFSPIVSKEICNKAEIDPTAKVYLLEKEEAVRLLEELVKLMNFISKSYDSLNDAPSPSPCIYYDAFNKVVDINFMDILAYQSSGYRQTKYPSYSEALNFYYFRRNKDHKSFQKSNNLRKVINQRIDRDRNKLVKLKTEISNAKNFEEYKVKGELILANIYKLNKGMTSFTALNYYLEDPVEIEVELDLKYEPQENAQRYFKKYNKLKTAQVLLVSQISESESNIDYLENVLVHLDSCDTASDIDDIRQEIADQGLIKQRLSKKQPKKKKKPKMDFREYLSTDGFTILVGRNNNQNDLLTLKYASNKDVWLHTKIIPGSHTIIRTEGKDVPDTTLLEAAMIAAYHSKAKESSSVPVDYCPVKNVSKPNGAKPGMVIYNVYNTIYTTPLEEQIDLLKK